MTLVRLFTALVVLSLAAACGSSNTNPTRVTFTQSDLRIGTGTTAASGKTLTVSYTGWLYDPSKVDFKGLVFDTSTGVGPFSFTLGNGQVIQGWDQGLVGMKVGGLRQLVIPPELAYGSSRNGVIPPNAALLFEIELTDVQ